MKHLNLTRCIALFLLCTAVMPVFAGCSAKNSDGLETTLSQETTAAPETTEVAPEEKTLGVIKDGEMLMTIIRPEKCSSTVLHSAVNLGKNFIKMGAHNYKIKDDWIKPGTAHDPATPEILVGLTNREVSAELYAKLPENSYGIAITGNTVAIVGKDDSLTAIGLYAFEREFMDNKEFFLESGEFCVPAEKEIIDSDNSLDNHKNMIKSHYHIEALASNDRTVNKFAPYNYSQGATTDGEHVYNVMYSKVDGKEICTIVKKNLSDWETVAKSEPMDIGHGNDMCYNKRENVLVVANMRSATLTRINPETLEIIDKVEVKGLKSGYPYAVTYNYDKNWYAILCNGYVYILDSKFTAIGMYDLIKYPEYIGQGMDSDNDYIYVPMSFRDNKKNDNIIIVYDWNGRFVKKIILDLHRESETIFNHDGKYYISFNYAGATVCDLTFEIIYK